MPEHETTCLKGNETADYVFKFGKVIVYLANKELIVEKGGNCLRYRYRDISLVSLESVSRSISLVALLIAFITRGIYYMLKPMPPYFEYIFLIIILICATVAIYGIIEGGDYIAIYISGKEKPLRIKGKRKELEKALKTIRKTIRKRR